MKRNRKAWSAVLVATVMAWWIVASPTAAQQEDQPQPSTDAVRSDDSAAPPRQANDPRAEDDSPNPTDDGQSAGQRRRADFQSADEDDRPSSDARRDDRVRREDRGGNRDDNNRDDNNRDDNDRDDNDRDDSESDERQENRERWETGISFEMDPGERLIVAELEDDAVLARAGLRRGDVILSINGRPVDSREDFLRWIHVSRPDRPIAMVVWRNGSEEELFLDVYRFDGRDSEIEQDRSDFGDARADRARATLGVVLDLRWDNAAVVEVVHRGSPADEAGVRAGDQIVRFNGRRVTSPQHLVDLVARQKAGDSVEIEVARRVTRSMDVVLDTRESVGDSSRYAEQPRRDADRGERDFELEAEDDLELDD